MLYIGLYTGVHIIIIYCFHDSPLVREKLDLEDIAMASIQSKQDETDEELRQTMKRLQATQEKTKEAKILAAKERALIKKDVDIIRNLLNVVRYSYEEKISL
jgi:polysaccharide pyruvyl transferase WcaK-like protein